MSSSAILPDVALMPLSSNDAPVFISRRLASLIAEHDDLDAAIGGLLALGTSDDLLIARLKKRKLVLKDEIAVSRP